MNVNCRSKNSYAISICSKGHATLHMGRNAISLDIEELRSLLDAGRNALEEFERSEKSTKKLSLLETFVPQTSH